MDEKQRDKLGLGKYGTLYTGAELMEISVVAVPANPSALEEGVKSLVSQGALEGGMAARFFSVYPKDEESALKKVRAACRSFVDMAANQLADSIAEPAEAYASVASVEKAPEEAPVHDTAQFEAAIDPHLWERFKRHAAGAICSLADDAEDAVLVVEALDAPVEEKSPACRQDGETVDECVSRKVPELIDEGMDDDQAVAVAHSMCETDCGDKNKSDERLVEAMASLIEQQAEQTKATRQLVDSLTDLTRTLHGETRGGTEGGSVHEPEAGVPDADELTQEKIDNAVNSAFRGFAARVRRDILSDTTNPSRD